MRLIFSILWLFSIVFVEKLGAQASFEASLDTRQAIVGSSVELSFSLKNVAGSGFRPPKIEGFRLVNGPNVSNSTTILNGTVTRGTTWSYLIQPLREGQFQIGPATIVVDGKTMKSAPLKLDVVKSRATKNSNQKKNAAPWNAAERQDDVLVSAEPGANEIWLGQQVSLDYKMLTRRDLSGVEVNYEPKYNGFFAQNLERFDRSDHREMVDGKPYLSKILKKIALFPQQTGVLNIEPMLLQAGVIEDGGGMFGGFFSQARPTVLTTETVRIKVKPLPLPVPPNFCGAIGSYSLATSISQNVATTDDAVSIKLTLTGNGDGRRVNPPVLSWPVGFEVSQSKMADESSFENGEELVSTKTFEYILLPKMVGEFGLPIEVVVFDPENGQFKTISANQKLTLKILQGNKKIEPIAPPADELIEKMRPELTDGPGSFFSLPVLFGLIGIAGLAVFGLFFIKKNQRQKPVEQFVQAALKPKVNQDFARIKMGEAQVFMENNDATSFYLGVSEAVEFHFSEKFRLDPAQVSREVLLEKMGAAGEGREFIEKFERVWRVCEMARFAGMPNAGSMAGILADAQYLIGKH